MSFGRSEWFIVIPLTNFNNHISIHRKTCFVKMSFQDSMKDFVDPVKESLKKFYQGMFLARPAIGSIFYNCYATKCTQVKYKSASFIIFSFLCLKIWYQRVIDSFVDLWCSWRYCEAFQTIIWWLKYRSERRPHHHVANFNDPSIFTGKHSIIQFVSDEYFHLNQLAYDLFYGLWKE